MHITPVSFNAGLPAYQAQADALLHGWKTDDRDAIRLAVQRHPKFLRPDVPWLPRNLTDADIRSASFEMADAQMAIARWYDFADWQRLEEYVDAVNRNGSTVARFEAGVEAVINGDVGALRELLRDDPELIRARSTRVTHFDPPVHRATLLHYVAANGVEGYRQRTPPNAVAVAALLLESSAEVDALADMYGGQCTTMSMLVSSGHPAKAGVQVALVETLLDFGAALDAQGSGEWTSPLATALAFGYLPAAHALVGRGARMETLAVAAGLGLLDDARRLLPAASALDRHRATALAAQHALAGHAGVVRLLVERGARLDIKDTIHEGTPLGWAEYGGRQEIAEYLRASFIANET
jgi:hypothetical protein